MKNLTLILTIFLVSKNLSVFSQTENMPNWCGTTFTEEMLEKVQTSTEKYMNGGLIKSRIEYNIPVTIHNMRESNGAGGVDMLNLLDVMCEAMDFYASLGINLYIDDIKNVDSTEWSHHASSNLATINLFYSVDNTINIYLFNSTEPSLLLSCGYYSPSHDVAVLIDSCIKEGIMIHELGHVFGLPHTFQGHQIGIDNCGVYVTFGEKVDGSNCTTAADRICDTPPDNNSAVRGSCVNCLQYDPDGVAFMADPANYMSYFSRLCYNKLTEGQVAVMIDNIENERADHINTNFINTNPVIEAVQLNSPINVEKPYDEVLFEWDATPNATLYYIEISRSNSFDTSFKVDFTITKETQYTSRKLKENMNYYWRVLPINGANCSTENIWTSGAFTTSDQTVLLPHIEDFNIAPNPAENESVAISLTGRRFMVGQLHLYSTTGQRVHSKNIQVFEGVNTYNLDVNELAAGLYLVYAEFDNESVWQKLIVQ